MQACDGRGLFWGCALALTLVACTAGEPERQPVEPVVAPSLEEWLRVEELTRDLEFDLVELGRAVTAGDRRAAAAFVAAEVSGRPFPAARDGCRREHAWVEARDWPAGRGRLRLSRRKLLDSLFALREHFAELEDLRFEVSGSQVHSDRAAEVEALVSGQGVARDGRREWLRGEVRLAVQREDAEGDWKIGEFAVERLHSLLAAAPLHEVTIPAGVDVPPDAPLKDAIAAGTAWYPNGASARDLDGDGFLDLFVTGPERNYLYLNRGDGTFREAAAEVGLREMVADMAEFAPVFFDYDNDGDLDLFTTLDHRNALFENRRVPEGRLYFRDASSGLDQVPDVQGWSVAVGDVDGDALPDLYVPSYFAPSTGPYPSTTIDDVNGDPNVLLINQGDGLFVNRAAQRGVDDRRFGLAAQFADVDGDFDLDLFVANDFGGGNAFYFNRGDGHFVDRAEAAGVPAAESMGVSFADYDNDGDLDLHVTNMSSVAANRVIARFPGDTLRRREHLVNQWRGNWLLENLGDGRFREVSATAGPFHAEWAWGGGFLDLDNDGWEDLHSPNGNISVDAPQDARGAVFSGVIAMTQAETPEKGREYLVAGLREMGRLRNEHGYSFAGWTRDRFYLNRGDGTFLDISGVAGADTWPSDARASLYADFDNDGDLDLFVRATHGKAHFLFRNEIGQRRAFLRVALEGRDGGRDAFGATVRVKTAGHTYTKVKRGSNGYLGQSDPRLLFGLGDSRLADVEWIEVGWPSGSTQRYPGPPAADSLLLVEGEREARPVAEGRSRLGG